MSFHNLKHTMAYDNLGSPLVVHLHSGCTKWVVTKVGMVSHACKPTLRRSKEARETSISGKFGYIGIPFINTYQPNHPWMPACSSHCNFLELVWPQQMTISLLYKQLYGVASGTRQYLLWIPGISVLMGRWASDACEAAFSPGLICSSTHPSFNSLKRLPLPTLCFKESV